ncbi:MAG: hypothetical protein ACLFP2_04990 [Candidatus Woesearchaeota archaeon]
METNKLIEESLQNINVAEYLINRTYHTVEDSRLLLSGLENTFLAFTKGISAILYHERKYKHIPKFPETLEGKISIFRDTSSRLKLEQYLNTIDELREVLVAHQKSAIEFTKKDRLVICSDDYNLNIITADVIKKHLSKAKEFIEEIRRVTNE